MSYTITRRTLDPQPALVASRRVEPTGIAGAIGEVLPKVFQHAQARGIAVTGRPFVRYGDMSGGSFTIEPGMPVASLPSSDPATGEEDVRSTTLQGGEAATTIHVGPYQRLGEAYTAIERWMSENGVKPAGAPWESYLTDPGEHPDPKDWRTEVVWPIR
jgi:AraC family transcriptional regulator